MNFLKRLPKNTQISNFMKIPPVETELLHAQGRTEGQTDNTKLKVDFRNVRNAPKENSELQF